MDVERLQRLDERNEIEHHERAGGVRHRPRRVPRASRARARTDVVFGADEAGLRRMRERRDAAIR